MDKDYKIACSIVGDDAITAQSPKWRDLVQGLIGSTHLMLLFGSGASYGLVNSSGDKAPMMDDLFVLVKNLPSYGNLIKEYSDFSAIDNVEELLSAVQAASSLPGAKGMEKDFLEDSTFAIREACDFVDDATSLDAHQRIIRRLAYRDARQSRLAMYTTNYDLALEVACQRIDYTVIDGFGYGSRARFSGRNYDMDVVVRGSESDLTLAPNVLRLFKLHGSVDWDEIGGHVIRRQLPDEPVLIYPSANKYRQSYRQPFLESVSQFQIDLRARETTLIAIGFGFNDDHLNQPIIDALLSNPSFRLMAVAPSALKRENMMYRTLSDAVEARDSRISLLEATLDEFSELLPEAPESNAWEQRRNEIANLWSAK